MNTQKIASQRCVPCEGGVAPYNARQIAIYKPQIPEWDVIENKKLQREFKFNNFTEALEFINKVGKIAESENHHPDIFLHNWNKVVITLWTHKIKGLFLNDFILASKIDELK